MSGAAVRIVHIIPRDGLGGVETAARTMAARVDLPCEFHLLFIAGDRLSSAERAPGPRSESTARPFAYLAALRRCLALRPDVVIASLWRSVPLLLALRMVRPTIKRVLTVNSGASVHWVDALMFRLGVAVADEVWSDSRSAAETRGLGHSDRIISFVASRFDPAPTRFTDPPRPHFASWARIDRNKRFEVALDLIARLVARGQDARFDLFGPDGGEVPALTSRAAKLGIADRVRFRGPVDRTDLAQATADASFFILPSRTEGMAMACVEAMQLGLVPVVTPTGEMAAYVVPGDNGLRIDPDRMDTAADEVADLIADPPRFSAMRRRASDRWREAPLYADDICAAATALAKRPIRSMGRRA